MTTTSRCTCDRGPRYVLDPACPALCDRTADCPAAGGHCHWWDCLTGQAFWRARDHYSSTPRAAAAVERVLALGTGRYLDPEPPPSGWEIEP